MALAAVNPDRVPEDCHADVSKSIQLCNALSHDLDELDGDGPALVCWSCQCKCVLLQGPCHSAADDLVWVRGLI